jgi:hypothetical protein
MKINKGREENEGRRQEKKKENKETERETSVQRNNYRHSKFAP